MINGISNNSITFSSRRLAEVFLRKQDGTPVKAFFTELEKKSKEDKNILSTLKKKWKFPDDISIPLKLFSQKIYAIELPDNRKPLADRIVTLAGISKDEEKSNIFVEALITKPEYQFGKRRGLEGCGRVMMGMLTKITKKLGLDEISLDGVDDSKKFYEERLKMHNRIDSEGETIYYLKGKGKDRAIKEIEAEFKLGKINLDDII
ncbi:MAG: hypothetical protein A2Y25_11820 [Candidatus Melainabacteria bacterium GWF2_37_15]|nr:MAG: hypothetical protein A2Y25_11820 [Candidatus Melainabacteria bacterium GWF2_37_15]